MAKYCGDCGSKLEDTALFCSKCGSRQDSENHSVSYDEPKHEKVFVSDDFLYESDYREDIEDTVINNGNGCVLTLRTKSKMKTKQIQNAIRFCDNKFSMVDIIVLMDTTVMDTMKDGMVFTYDSAYKISDGVMKFKLKYNQIAKMEHTTDGTAFRYPVIRFTLINGRTVDLRCGKNDSTYYRFSKMWNLFLEICNCINRFRDHGTKINIIQ